MGSQEVPGGGDPQSGQEAGVREPLLVPYHGQDLGHLTIKMFGHPPFGAQVILNGHEYVACQTQSAGVGFTKEGNCFTAVADPAALAEVADTLSRSETIRRLSQVCDRWIYSTCLCFGLDVAKQDRSGFRYGYSVYQVEYSRNLLFAAGAQMDRVFNAVVDRTRSRLDVPRVRTLFGAKHRPRRRSGVDLSGIDLSPLGSPPPRRPRERASNRVEGVCARRNGA